MWISLYLSVIWMTHAEECDPHHDSYGGYAHPKWWCATLCVEAPDESPININTSDAIDGEEVCTSRIDWKVDWKHDLFKVENNCHSLQVTPLGFDEARILSPFTDYLRTAAVLATENTPFEGEYDDYCFAQLHFHWGINETVGSEHTVNGNAFPLEAHFVHYACEYLNVTAATNRGVETTLSGNHTDHTLAVVSILFDVSQEDNPAFNVLLSDSLLDKVRNCSAESSEVVISDPILNDLIPRHVEHGGYYAYKGSLTTPPCTDDVNWFVMKTHGTVSEKQLLQFRQLLNEDQEEIVRNWRKIQSNVNVVMDCDDDMRDEHKHKSYRKVKRKYHHREHRDAWYNYQEPYQY